jgi:DNA-directed RNA polymerase subunit RPC12/RpoP
VAFHSTVQELACVHCGKAFRAEVLSANTKQAGVKCPHCRLFMPLGRVEASDARPSG